MKRVIFSLRLGLQGLSAALLLGGLVAVSHASFSPNELAARSAHVATAIEVESVVVDHAGLPQANFVVRALNAQGVVERATATTDRNGYFLLDGLARENAMLEVRAAGFHPKFVYVQLAKPRTQGRVTLDPIILEPVRADTARFVFGGDTAWVRRLYDTDIDGKAKLFEIPPSDPAAIIDTANPLPGTRSTTQYVQPYFKAADFSSINLETPVLLTEPFTPHVEKDFAFFSLPESLEVLPELGVDYVALGNNHLYDYLELGVTDTRAALPGFAAGVGYSGAGSDENEAVAAHRFTLKGHQYSMLSGTSITGQFNEFSSDDFLYIARDSLGKGGAADLTRSRFYNEIGTEAIDRVPIAQLHTGDEYTFEPTTVARRRMTDAADAGAKLVIAHHPHVAQGLEFYGPDGVLFAHSLGNFLFDQERLETMHGLTLQLDYAGSEFRGGQAQGIYLEDFRPRPIAADQAAGFLRRINEFSRQALVFPYNGKGRIQPDSSGTAIQQYTTSQSVVIGADGWSVVDLRGLTDSLRNPVPVEASLASFSADANVSVRLGRDIMERHGEFEDWDVDDDGVGVDPTSTDANSYGARWDWRSSQDAKFICFDRPYRGMVAGCSTRRASFSSDTVIAFRNRIRVMRAESSNPIMPNRDITLFGYARGDNAGPMRVEIKFYPSREEQVSFIPADGSPNEVVALGSGTFDWTAFAADLTLPPDDPSAYPDVTDPNISNTDLKVYLRTLTARALRIFLDHSPPATGEGTAAFDELAVINWEPAIALNATSGSAAKTPHPLDFMRVEGVPGSTVNLSLNFSRLIPEIVKDIRVAAFRDELFVDGFEN